MKIDPYPAVLEKEGEGYTVTFPDLPEAITEGDDLEMALFNAAEALTLALEQRIDDGDPCHYHACWQLLTVTPSLVFCYVMPWFYTGRLSHVMCSCASGLQGLGESHEQGYLVWQHWQHQL